MYVAILLRAVVTLCCAMERQVKSSWICFWHNYRQRNKMYTKACYCIEQQIVQTVISDKGESSEISHQISLLSTWRQFLECNKQNEIHLQPRWGHGENKLIKLATAVCREDTGNTRNPTCMQRRPRKFLTVK